MPQYNPNPKHFKELNILQNHKQLQNRKQSRRDLSKHNDKESKYYTRQNDGKTQRIARDKNKNQK